ncbi:MAG TPA: hypothetical protein P5087_02460 [Eubacteriales bacterium]|nr:hypothetical protein [Eubacteriales bacterium]
MKKIIETAANFAKKNNLVPNFLLSETEKKFNEKPLIPVILVAGKITHLEALNIRETNNLLIRKFGYIIKKGDKLIDEHDSTYFVEDVDPNYIYEFENDYKLEVLKITYKKQPLELPQNTMQQIANINNTININTTGEVNNISNNSNIVQRMTSNQILQILEQVVESSYDIENLRKLIEEIKTLQKKNAEIKYEKLKNFLKKAGTVCVELVKAFVVTYAVEFTKNIIGA